MVYASNSTHSCIIAYTSDTVTLQVFVQPNASKTECVGIYENALRIRLQAPAIENKANTMLCAYIAQLLNIKKRRVSILRGEHSRMKQVLLQAPLCDVESALQRIL